MEANVLPKPAVIESTTLGGYIPPMIPVIDAAIIKAKNA